MKQVFTGLNNVEAHVIAHLLEAEGIKTSLSGEYLSSARGELAAQDQGKVWVMADADEVRALELIARWEKRNPTSAKNATHNERPDSRPNRAVIWMFISFVMGCLLTYSYFYSPVFHDGADNKGDGKLDMHYTYKNNLIAKVEGDLNFDGKIDLKEKYDVRGLIKSSLRDMDYDGVFETTMTYENGAAEKEVRDYNQDGKTDIEFFYRENGDIKTTQLYDPKTGRLVKISDYENGTLISALYDSDQNGSLDIKYTYDPYKEIASKINLSTQKSE